MIAQTNVFAHEALLYQDDHGYIEAVADFVRAGLAMGEPVLVAVPTANLTRIRNRLGPNGRRVEWADMTDVGRNPGRILPALMMAFADRADRPRVRIVGEPIWAGRTPVEYPACVQHEALVNRAFAGRHAVIMCPYDAGRLDPSVLEDAERTHPTVWAGAVSRSSSRYADPENTAAGFNVPLPEPPPYAGQTIVDLGRLAAARWFVTEEAITAGMSAQAVSDLTFAVNELAANSVEHGGGVGRLAVWSDGTHLVCQISDRGHICDPLAGRLPVPTHGTRGRGLLLVHHFCDLVRIHTEPGATTIRVQVRLDR